MVKPPEPTIYHDSKKYLILLPLRAIYFRSFHYETPCIRGFLCVFVFHMYVDSNNFCHLYYPQAILQIKCLRQRKNFTFQLKYFFVKKTFVHNLLPYNKAMLLCILAKVFMASEGAKKVICKIKSFQILNEQMEAKVNLQGLIFAFTFAFICF